MILPREILEYVAKFLDTNDQYNCLTVCKSWYPAFLYSLYRYIHLLSDEKTIQLQSTLKNCYQMGYLVRHVSFQAAKSLRLGLGVQIKEYKPVKISQDVLDTLDQSCPLIESLSFDQDQWSSASLSLPKSLLLGLCQLPAINFNLFTQIMAKNSSGFNRLTHLHIRGNVDMIQDRVSAINLLAYTPHINQLIFERDDLHNKYKTPVISLEHLDRIHQYLPQLVDLQFINHFNFGISNYYIHQIQPELSMIQPQKKFQHLKLEGTLQAYQWIQYISQLYPSLKSLTLDLVYSPFSGIFAPPPMQFINFKVRESFQSIVDHYQHLRIIRIRSLSTPLWLTPKFIAAFDSKPFPTEIDAQLYGLDFKGVEKSIEVLTPKKSCNINLTGVRLPIWRRHSHHTNPLSTWRDTIRPLRVFKGLSHLELDAVSMSYVNTSNEDDGFVLDTILNILPSLTSLKLSGSTLQLSKQRSMQQGKKSTGLKELVLHKIAFSTLVMNYLSVYCNDLKRLIMYDCQQKESRDDQKLKISIDLHNLSLDLIVLYRIRHPYQLVESRAPGARFVCVNNQHWSHLSVRSEGNCEAKPLHDRSKIKQITQFNDILLEEWNPNRARYHTENEWQQDLIFGHIYLECKAVKSIFLDESLVLL